MAAVTCHSEASFAGRHDGLMTRIADTIGCWRDRARRRARDRAELPFWQERDLHDAGISRNDVLFELNKPFWRD